MSDIDDFSDLPEEQDQSGSLMSKLSLRDVFHVLFRHKLKIFLCSLVGAGIAGYLYFTAPLVYRSEAHLLVRFVADSAALDSDVTGQSMASGRNWQHIFNSEKLILVSQDVADKTVDLLGVDAFFGGSGPAVSDDDSARQRAARFVRGNLSVITPSRSNIIKLTFDGSSPQLSQRVLEAYIRAYLEIHLAIHQSAGSYEFLAQQTDLLRAKIAENEDELRALMHEHEIVNMEEKRRTILARLDALREEMKNVESDLAGAGARVEKLRAMVPDEGEEEIVVDVPMYANFSSANLEERLAQLRRRELDFLSKFTENSVPVRDVRRQIAETLQEMKYSQSLNTTTGETRVAYGDLKSVVLNEEARIASLEGRLKALGAYREKTRDELASINVVEGRLKQLQRELDVQEKSYRRFSEDLEQARMQQVLELRQISNISEVQSPTLPNDQIRPIEPRRIMAIFFGGIFGGIVLAYLSEFRLDRTFKRPDEVEAKLNVPMLAAIPYMRPRGVSRLIGRDPSLLPSVQESEKGKRPDWAVNPDVKKSYAWIAQRILMATNGNKNGPYILGVTSSHYGEGVTTIAASLAYTISRHGEGRVLLVDANIDAAVSHDVFGALGAPGLAELLSDGKGGTTIVQQKLFVVPAGEVRSESPEKYDAAKFARLLGIAKEKDYDFVVLDMPPLLESGYAGRMAGLLNGVIFTVEAERTSFHSAGKALDLLHGSGTPVVGAILNKRRFYVPRWLYKRV